MKTLRKKKRFLYLESFAKCKLIFRKTAQFRGKTLINGSAGIS